MMEILMERQTHQAIYSSPDIPFDNYLCNTIACQLVVGSNLTALSQR